MSISRQKTEAGRAGRFLLLIVFVAVFAGSGVAATLYSGQVTFGGLPVPGAAVTASQGEKQFVTTTDQQGVFRLADLADGAWSIRIEMQGFATLTRDVTVAPDAPPSTWELTLLSFEEIARGAAPADTGDARLKPDAATAATTTALKPNATTAANPENAGNAGNLVDPASAADGLLVNGSVNNGAASPFAQLAAFGNNRRGARSLYNWGFGAILGNSAWDSRPFSFTSERTPKPSYA